MKDFKKITLTWIIIILFLIIIIVLYNRMDNQYTEPGEDAPIPSELHPIVEENKVILLDRATDINIDLVITEGMRSFSRQNKLYNQGRSGTGNIVTYAKAGESYHNYGLAIDYALRNSDGKIIWDIHYDGNNNGKADWFEVAQVAKELGFEWGGDFKDFKDYPHLQMTFDLSINQLQRGLRPVIEEADQ
ncbi:peptidase [Virgibacillus profundi]|uniref:Peptidase n=1 Tax=Virgibacillus profundi TaxID=2024555 RepID=A0A2A2IHM4_9BACI|nr:M15 family metallopeptidase [Virgibacillus profundi]PAV30603.1 peptidase [Virgibacillus profundi]PXY54775.1 M15 family peptidase [Virgibacillus profundi]